MTKTNSKGFVATIGFFDGVHLGHRFLIDYVIETAKKSKMQSMVVTFSEHPRKVLHTDFQPELLTTKDEKMRLLKGTGIDEITMLDFTKELSQMPAKDFMQLLYNTYEVRVLVVGYDHRFGCGRAEVFDDYHKYGDEMGMRVIKCPHFKLPKGSTTAYSISSTSIRKALAAGKVKTATDLLGHRFILSGEVVHGFHNGTDLGYPTANIKVEDGKLIPMEGVYLVNIIDGNTKKKTYGMLNIGSRPTLDNGGQQSIEAHIFDCNTDLYGNRLEVELIEFLRKEKKFDDIDSLKAQLKSDEEACRLILKSEELKR
jgi:riboflavin kinase/FMN adenylyltransferase